MLEAAAFGVNCEHYGERIEAGIVLKNQEFSTEKELINHCINSLGEFKSPDKIHFFSNLPKGASGKIQRLKIKDRIKSSKKN